MKKRRIYSEPPVVYFVEGETEQAVVDAIKGTYILPGKSYVLPIAQKGRERSIREKIRQLKPDTICVLVFDGDIFKRKTGNYELLMSNIKLFQNAPNLKQTIVVCQNIISRMNWSKRRI
jgi:hypothetical protein